MVVEVQRGGSWVPKDWLDQGMSTLVGPGARFFVATRQQETLLQLRAIGAAGSGSGAGELASAPGNRAGQKRCSNSSIYLCIA